MKHKNVFLRAILAGICISIGCWLYLRGTDQYPSSIAGVLFFSTGVILISNFDFYLYTGKIGYVFTDKDHSLKHNLSALLIGFIGNFIGAFTTGQLLRLVFLDINPTLFNTLNNNITTKISYPFYNVLIIAFFCGILVYLAVQAFKKVESTIAKYIIIFICISGFCLAGFDQCIATIFYFSLNNTLNWSFALVLSMTVLGNTLGCLFIPFVQHFNNKK